MKLELSTASAKADPTACVQKKIAKEWPNAPTPTHYMYFLEYFIKCCCLCSSLVHCVLDFPFLVRTGIQKSTFLPVPVTLYRHTGGGIRTAHWQTETHTLTRCESAVLHNDLVNYYYRIQFKALVEWKFRKNNFLRDLSSGSWHRCFKPNCRRIPERTSARSLNVKTYTLVRDQRFNKWDELKCSRKVRGRMAMEGIERTWAGDGGGESTNNRTKQLKCFEYRSPPPEPSIQAPTLLW